MGKESREKPSGYGETQTHHVCISPEEDRGSTAGKMGEGEGWEEISPSLNESLKTSLLPNPTVTDRTLPALMPIILGS
jgi:hypothetical protein